jgi:hypothetical protein
MVALIRSLRGPTFAEAGEVAQMTASSCLMVVDPLALMGGTGQGALTGGLIPNPHLQSSRYMGKTSVGQWRARNGGSLQAYGGYMMAQRRMSFVIRSGRIQAAGVLKR